MEAEAREKDGLVTVVTSSEKDSEYNRSSLAESRSIDCAIARITDIGCQMIGEIGEKSHS